MRSLLLSEGACETHVILAPAVVKVVFQTALRATTTRRPAGPVSESYKAKCYAQFRRGGGKSHYLRWGLGGCGQVILRMMGMGEVGASRIASTSEWVDGGM